LDFFYFQKQPAAGAATGLDASKKRIILFSNFS